MPSDFSYLPPASRALQFIVFYQQFTITMYFSPLLISLPYSSMRVTSRDGCSLNLLKLFILCFGFCGQFSSAHLFSALQVVKAWFIYTVHSTQFILHSSIAQFIHTHADTTKTCESFYFRLLSQVQKLHSYKCTLIKAPTFQRIKNIVHDSLIRKTVQKH